MFHDLPILLRLTLCMFFSFSVHGAAFYDWSQDAGEMSQTTGPVSVSLVPSPRADKPVSSALAPAPPRQVEEKKNFVPSGIAAKVPEKQRPEKVAKRASATEPKTIKKDETSADELACPLPQDATSEQHTTLDGPALACDAVMPSAANNTKVARVLKPTVAPEKGKGLLAGTATPAEELTKAIPKYRSNPLPDYPYRARLKRWEGVVWLLVDVSADGLVDDLRVEQSCGHRLLDRTASRTVRRWQFTPAKRAGLPVLSQVRVPVRFRLEDD